MKSITAVYAGSFDPLTNGHLWVIQEAAAKYDRLIVAVGVNPDKKCNFTIEERMDMIQQSIEGQYDNVVVTSFPYMFLVDYASEMGASVIIRGLRSAADLDSETTMANINRKINPRISTFFVIPPEELIKVSSSMVRSLVGPKGWENIVRNYVPLPVLKKLRGFYNAKQ